MFVYYVIFMVNTSCDGCSEGFTVVGKIRRLNTGGDSGAYLCRKCWAKEMVWRKLRNETLEKSVRFPIIKFPS